MPTTGASTGEDTEADGDTSGPDTAPPAGQAPVGDGGGPAGTPGQPGAPVPEAPRLISAGGLITPSIVDRPGDQHYAKKVCEAFDRNKFLGIRGWKLANPAQAKLFTGVAGIKPGSYWTTANYRGAGKVVSLPGGRDRSVSARKNAARALCVAPQG